MVSWEGASTSEVFSMWSSTICEYILSLSYNVHVDPPVLTNTYTALDELVALETPVNRPHSSMMPKIWKWLLLWSNAWMMQDRCVPWSLSYNTFTWNTFTTLTIDFRWCRRGLMRLCLALTLPTSQRLFIITFLKPGERHLWIFYALQILIW